MYTFSKQLLIPLNMDPSSHLVVFDITNIYITSTVYTGCSKSHGTNFNLCFNIKYKYQMHRF